MTVKFFLLNNEDSITRVLSRQQEKEIRNRVIPHLTGHMVLRHGEQTLWPKGPQTQSQFRIDLQGEMTNLLDFMLGSRNHMCHGMVFYGTASMLFVGRFWS